MMRCNAVELNSGLDRCLDVAKHAIIAELDFNEPDPVNTLTAKVFIVAKRVGSDNGTTMFSITSEGFGPKIAFHVQEEIKS